MWPQEPRDVRMWLQKQRCSCRIKKVLAGANMQLKEPINDYRSQNVAVGAIWKLQEQDVAVGAILKWQEQDVAAGVKI